MAICGIYLIKNLVTDECYIGQSKDIERRWESHKRDAAKKKYQLYSSIRAFGIDNFDFSVLEICKPEELDNKELQWIKVYHDAGIHLYNIIGIPEKEKYVKARRNKAINKRK